MNKGRTFLVLSAILLCVFLPGCGYSMTRLLPPTYRVILVEPLRNEIPTTQEISEQFGYQAYLPEMEEKVTRGIIDRFLFDGNLRVTNKKGDADLVIQGRVLSFSRQPVRQHLEDNTVEEYRLNLVGAISLRDRQGQLLWEEPNLVGDATYFVTGASAKSESAAVDELITDFSRRVVERVVENW